MNNADQCLARSQACLNFGTEGFFFNSCNEIFDHGNGNVCLKEGNTNFTQHVLHVGFGQTSLSANGFDDFGKTLSKRIEHYINSKERVKSYNTINYIKKSRNDDIECHILRFCGRIVFSRSLRNLQNVARA